MRFSPPLLLNSVLLSSSLLSATLLSGCAPSAGAVGTSVLVPAGSPGVAPYRERLAVLRFDGNAGTQLSSDLEGLLSSHSVNGQAYFSLVDRTALDKVLLEVARGQSGMVSSATATKVGKLSGAKGLLQGSAEGTSSEGRITKKVLSIKGGLNLVDASCTRRSANFTLNVRLVGTESGAVVYSSAIKKSATDDLCEGDLLSSFARPSDLLEQAKGAALKELLYDLAPHMETFNLPLLEDTTITPASAASNYASGLEFARAKRLDRACEFWQKAYRLNPAQPTLLYSLGVCAEVGGNLNEALRWYTQADRALSKPNSVISEALSRIQAQIRNKGKS